MLYIDSLGGIGAIPFTIQCWGGAGAETAEGPLTEIRRKNDD